MINNKDFIRPVAKRTGALADDSVIDQMTRNFLEEMKRDMQNNFNKNNNYHIKFSSKRVAANHVKPDSWVNQTLLQRYASQLANWFNANTGKLPLLPETIYVAWKPCVEFIVNEKTIGNLKSDLFNQNCDWLEGGVKFSNVKSEQVSPSSDNELADTLVQEILANMENLNDGQELSDSQWGAVWLFIVKQKAQEAINNAPIQETNIKLIFEHKTNDPVILGVVSKVMQI